MNFDEISLADCRIQAIKKGDKSISIEFEQVFDIISKKFIRSCVLIIKNWTQFSAKLFISSQPFSKATEKVLTENEFETFEIIQESELTNNELFLKGFSKESGAWMEWKFLNSAYEFKVNPF